MKKKPESDRWKKGEDAKNKRFVKRDVETSSEEKKTNTNKRSGWGHILRWKKNYRIWWMKKRKRWERKQTEKKDLGEDIFFGWKKNNEFDRWKKKKKVRTKNKNKKKKFTEYNR